MLRFDFAGSETNYVQDSVNANCHLKITNNQGCRVLQGIDETMWKHFIFPLSMYEPNQLPDYSNKTNPIFGNMLPAYSKITEFQKEKWYGDSTAVNTFAPTFDQRFKTSLNLYRYENWNSITWRLENDLK